MRIGVVGINYQHVALDVREAILTLWTQNNPLLLGLSSVLLSTCHRVELYFSSADPEDTIEQLSSWLSLWTPNSYSYVSNDCFTHLVRVAAGWESLFLGETDIQRQVRDAYRQATQNQTLDPALHYVFQKALKLSKELRTRYPLPPLLLAEELHERATTWGGDLSRRKTLFVGFSRTNRSIISLFLKRGVTSITCCNRTPMSSNHGMFVHWLPWERRHEWPMFDLVVVATTSPSYLVTLPTQPLSPSPRLLIDLSVPRNIDPALRAYSHLTLWNMDQIVPHDAVSTQASLAEIESKVSRYISYFLDKHRHAASTSAPPTHLEDTWCHHPILRKATETEMSISVQ